MASCKFAAGLILVLCSLQGVYLRGLHNQPGFDKLDLSDATGKDFFWYVNDNGKVVPALLKGGPPAASIDAIEDDVEFWLYRNGREPGVKISIGCTNNCLSTYAKGEPLIVLSHGFSSNHEGGFGEQHRNALAKRSETLNVIFINWEKLAGAPWYETAANNVKPVGEYTARLLNHLIQQGLASRDKIHFIGHSLGSHVGNHVGNNVNGGKIARLTGLDPALPLFGNKDDSQRLDPSDATFVDVMHTAMGTLLDGGLAFTEPRGHVDFYPNSGKNQPGCGVDAFGSCSHGRANAFFAESVWKKSFVACKCNSWEDYNAGRCTCADQALMGWDTPTSARGLYYLRTNANAPYGQS